MCEYDFSTVAGDVVKKGYLYIKRPPSQDKLAKFTRLKAWQRKFFVLRDIDPDTGIACLQLYPEESDYLSTLLNCVSGDGVTPTSPPKKKKSAEIVLDLKHVTNIESYTKSRSHPNAIKILSDVSPPLLISFHCDIDKASWTQALKQVAAKRQFIYKYHKVNADGRVEFKASIRDPSTDTSGSDGSFSMSKNLSSSDSELRSSGLLAVHSFRGPMVAHNLSFNESCDLEDFVEAKCAGVPVHLELNEDAARLNLAGEYYMNVYDGCVTLTDIATLKELVRWPVCFIDKFKNEINAHIAPRYLVTLEANRECGDFAGRFVFRTKHGPDLIARVAQATPRLASPRIPNSVSPRPLAAGTFFRKSSRKEEATRTTLLRKLSAGLLHKPESQSDNSRGIPSPIPSPRPVFSHSCQSSPTLPPRRKLSEQSQPTVYADIRPFQENQPIVYADIRPLQHLDSSQSSSSNPVDVAAAAAGYLEIVEDFVQPAGMPVPSSALPDYLALLPESDDNPAPPKPGGDYYKVWQLGGNSGAGDPGKPPPIPPRTRSNTWGTTTSQLVVRH